jgi:acyl-CoA thioesterase
MVDVRAMFAADSAAQAAGMELLDHGPGSGRTVGRSAQIEYLRPAARGDRLEAVATERMRNGRNGIYDVSVTRPGDGALIAEFRGNSRELPSSR